MPPKKFAHSCDACGKSLTHIRRHINRTHIPWYMNPAYACADCQQSGDKSDLSHFHSSHGGIRGKPLLFAWYLLVNGFPLFISRSLGVGSLETLLALVVEEKLYLQDTQFQEEEIFFLKEYDQLAGLEAKDVYSACPPTRVSELLHYRVMLQLVLRLPSDKKDLVQNYFCYSNPDGSSPPIGHPVLKLAVIDGHFHLDELIGHTVISPLKS